MNKHSEYSPRPIEFQRIIEYNGNRLKLYSIVYGDAPLERKRFEVGSDLALEQLPAPDSSAGRPGLGFVIAHQGNTADYIVLCYWANENELPIKVFVRESDDWRAASGDESICVWDMQIIWHERNAYVSRVMQGENADVEGYLGDVYVQKT